MVYSMACGVVSTTVYSFCRPLSSYYLVFGAGLVRPHLESHIHCSGTARLAMPLQGFLPHNRVETDTENCTQVST